MFKRHPRAMAAAWIVWLAALTGCGPAAQTRDAPLVLAASSLQGGLDDIADAWAARGHARPVLSYAGTAALARQVEQGAQADLFLSADQQWMDALETAGLLRPGTRADFAANRLVLIAPAGDGAAGDGAAGDGANAGGNSGANAGAHSGPNAGPNAGALDLARPSQFAARLRQRPLAMADPQAVPAGRYAKAALGKLGLWAIASDRIVPTDNVRGALALVERREAALGVVYATDAQASAKVVIAAEIPAAAHDPITYPLALLASSNAADAEGFRQFLLSPQSRAILAAHGFIQRQ